MNAKTVTPRCSARTKRGTRCASTVELRRVGTRWLCVAHDGERKAQRESRRKAAATRVPVTATWPLPDDRMPETADECRLIGAWATRELVRGGIDARTAHELAALVRATLKALEDGRGREDAAALRALLEELAAKQDGPSGPAAMRALGHEALARKRAVKTMITEEDPNGSARTTDQPAQQAARAAAAPAAGHEHATGPARAEDPEAPSEAPDKEGEAPTPAAAVAVPEMPPPEPKPASPNDPNSAFRADGSPKSMDELLRDARDPNRFR